MIKENAGPVTYTQEDFDLADKKISVCMAIVQTNSPFFSVLIKKLLIIPNIFIPTMCTDGNAILYNPKFTNQLSESEVIFVLEHEILHCALKHFIRIDGRKPKLWNYATDYAINFMLQEMYNDSNPENAKMPDWVLYDKKYADMKAEDIYDQLEAEGVDPDSDMLSQSPQEQSCPDCDGSGEKQDDDKQDSEKQDGSGDDDGGDKGDQQGGDNSGGDEPGDQDGDGDGAGGDGDSKEGDGNGDGEGKEGEGGDKPGSGSGHSHGGKEPCPSCGGSGKQPGGQPGQGSGQQGTQPGDQWNPGGVASPDQLKKYYTDPDNPGDKPNQNELDKTWDVAVKKAMKQAGNMPGNVKRMIGDVLAPIINWKSQLKRFINSLAKKNQYKLPNRRHIHSGKYLPGIKRSMDAITNIVVAIDTSGSINDEMLQRYLSEVYDILKRFEPEKTHILYIDTEVRSVDTIARKGKPDKNKSKGGGGTAFEPAFQWADKNLKPKDISVFLYFTDLYGDTSFKRPKWHHKVIWVLEKDSRELDVPWGKKLVLDSNFKIK